MKIGETLYKRSTVGKLLQWEVHVEGDSFYCVHGQVGGQLVTDAPTKCEAKNVGRSNETTPEEQAELEAKAKYQKKIDIGGYVANRADADRKNFSVTLAHKFLDHRSKLPDVVMVSPKLDGIRCYITKDGAFSRNGKRFVSTKFIEEDLKDFFKEEPDAILDGELYNHNYRDDFPNLVRLIKREKNFTEAQWEQIKKDLQYHVFDCYFGDAPNCLFRNRIGLVDLLIADHTFSDRIRVVINRQIPKADFMVAYEDYMKDGYEGIMIRDPNSFYEMKRSYKLLKYKEFNDAEYEIVDVLEGLGNRAGMAGKIVVKLRDGSTCESGLRGNDSLFTKMLTEKKNYIGKKATVRYQGFTPDGKLRFPVCVGIRDYE